MMYQCVEKYTERLEALCEASFETYGCVEYCGIQRVPDDRARADRDQAAAGLLDIFREFSWSDEFVTAFGVFCNFYVLTGMYQCLGEDEEAFGLAGLYRMLEDEEGVQYLEYIRRGILEQEEELFWKAVQMNIFDFSLPFVYLYMMNFEQLILYEREELEEEEARQDFLWFYHVMMEAKKHIAEEINANIEIQRIPYHEMGSVLQDQYAWKYMPGIVWFDDIYALSSAAVSDLRFLREYGKMQKIESMEDVAEGLKNAYSNDEDAARYWVFQKCLLGRINAMEILDVDLERTDFYEHERDSSLFERRFYLKLPMRISFAASRLLDYAGELELRIQKERLIEKNRKMVEDYSHSVENIIKPSLIGEIADTLRQDEKYKDLYKKLIQIYFSEVITQNECRLLRMTHDWSASAGAIRENIRRCRAARTDTVGVVSLKGLLYKAMNQVVMQIVDDKRSRMEFIREKLIRAGLSVGELEQGLWRTDQDIEHTFDFWRAFFRMEFQVEDGLSDRHFREEAVGTTFLFTRMTELLTNLFTYGEYGEGREFLFSIGTAEDPGGRRYLVFRTENVIGDRSYVSGQNGLESTEEMLERINSYDPERSRFVEWEETDGRFHARVYLEAELYL